MIEVNEKPVTRLLMRSDLRQKCLRLSYTLFTTYLSDIEEYMKDEQVERVVVGKIKVTVSGNDKALVVNG